MATSSSDFVRHLTRRTLSHVFAAVTRLASVATAFAALLLFVQRATITKCDVGQSLPLLVACGLHAWSGPLSVCSGCKLHSSFRIIQPFKGGQVFVVLQVIGWTLYGNGLLLAMLAFLYERDCNPWSIFIGLISVVSAGCLTASLDAFTPPPECVPKEAAAAADEVSPTTASRVSLHSQPRQQPSGWLLKRSEWLHSYNWRWVELRGDTLRWHDPAPRRSLLSSWSEPAQPRPARELRLPRQTTVVTCDGLKLTLTVSDAMKKLHFCARGDDEAQQWATALRAACGASEGASADVAASTGERPSERVRRGIEAAFEEWRDAHGAADDAELVRAVLTLQSEGRTLLAGRTLEWLDERAAAKPQGGSPSPAAAAAASLRWEMEPTKASLDELRERHKESLRTLYEFADAKSLEEVPPAAGSGSGWARTHQKGVTVLHRHDDAGELCLKLDATLRDVPAVEMAAVMREVSTPLYRAFAPQLKRAETLHRPSPMEAFFLFGVGVPGVFTRETILHAATVDALDEAGCVLLLASSVDDGETPQPKLPLFATPPPSAGRASCRAYRACLEVVAPTTMRIRISMRLRLNAAVPRFIVSFFMQVAAELITTMIEAARQARHNPAASPHARLLHEHPFYARADARFAAFCRRVFGEIDKASPFAEGR